MIYTRDINLKILRYPDALVFFLNANSEENLQADLETLIRSRGATYRSKSWTDALVYLAKEVKNWLVILDNADNPAVRLFTYIPKCTHGNVIITTRNSNHSIIARQSSYHIEGLSVEEATCLILTISGFDDTGDNHKIARGIVDELGCLPLAVSQAGAYIYVNKCLGTYLDMYRQNRAELLDSNAAQLPQDYQSSVSTTIRMSMD